MVPVGINNHYSNCFLNCAFQILSNLDGFNLRWKDAMRGKSCDSELLVKYSEFVESYANRKPDITSIYYYLVKCGMVKLNQQGDYHEVLLMLIDGLSRSMRRVRLRVPLPTLEDCFQGKLEKTVICGNCNNRSTVVEPFISLPFEESISRSVHSIYQPVKIENYHCESCSRRWMRRTREMGDVKCYSTATIHCRLVKMPLILSFHNQRKGSVSGLEDGMYRLSLPGGMKTNYRLYVVVYHRGSLGGGHYFCKVIKGDETYLIDDQLVRKAHLSDSENVVGIHLMSDDVAV